MNFLIPDKLTDNEIIKALGACLHRGCNVCIRRPEEYGATERQCSRGLMKDALDLINRQKAENEALINGQETLQKYIEEQKAEIERLRKSQGQIVLPARGGGKTYLVRMKIDDIRYEAVKEFADKVDREITEAIISNDKAIAEREKKHKVNRYEDNFCAMCDCKVVALSGLKSFIDNLVKEMVGDNE